MKLTKNQTALIEDAKAAGYTVDEDETTVRIYKLDGRSKRQKKVLRGIVLYESGTAFDLTVDLAYARGMRAFKDMRSVLRIENQG